jgi:hypothetical protein
MGQHGTAPGQSTDGYTTHSGVTAHTAGMMHDIDDMSDLETSADRLGATHSELSDSGLTSDLQSAPGVLRGRARAVYMDESDAAGGTSDQDTDSSGSESNSDA